MYIYICIYICIERERERFTCKELAHKFMEVEKTQDLQAASGDIGRSQK
jgi:hypothetical protein